MSTRVESAPVRTPPPVSGEVEGGGVRPRVLVVPASYFARGRTVGGGERYALEYARALSALTPTTLALFDTEPRRETDGTLEVRTFSVRHLNQRLVFPLTAESWRELGRFDVVHSMVFPTPLTDLLMLSARLRGQTAVLTDVGGGGRCWSTYLQKLHPRAGLNRLAHGLALLSRHSAGQFADWRQQKAILYGGVDLGALAPDGNPPGGYALFVGRLLPHKGVLQLIRAIGPDVPLRVVGRPYDPEYVRELRDAARGKDVRFVMDADDAELRRQYAGASVVLQPSIPTPGAADTSELLGLVTLEAMACGKPVIVTRAGSLAELVLDGRTGFVVSPEDAETLGARVRQLVQDPEMSARMGEAARRHVEEHFTWEQAAARGLELYRQLLPGRRAAGR